MATAVSERLEELKGGSERAPLSREKSWVTTQSVPPTPPQGEAPEDGGKSEEHRTDWTKLLLRVSVAAPVLARCSLRAHPL